MIIDTVDHLQKSETSCLLNKLIISYALNLALVYLLKSDLGYCATTTTTTYIVHIQITISGKKKFRV
jgi:hypothetical protein